MLRGSMTDTNTTWDLKSFSVAPEEGKTRFHDLGLQSLDACNRRSWFRYASPIQSESLPVVLDGEDIVAKAQTGTGKLLLSLFRS